MAGRTGLSDKVALVTGASRMSSIGRSIAVALAEAGCHVIVTGSGRHPDNYPEEERAAGWRDIESVAEEIRSHGVRSLHRVVDVTDEAAVRDLHAAVTEAFGRIDFVVNNAAARVGADRAPVVDMPIQAFEDVFRVNVRGAFLVSQVFGRQLIEQGDGGAIINISSVAGKSFPRNFAAYSSSKAALNALTKVMAAELGEHRIRVNAVCPGMIDTSRIAAKGDSPALVAKKTQLIPLGRTGTGADVAGLVLYLCSEEGAWMTGQAINIDGGMVMQH